MAKHKVYTQVLVSTKDTQGTRANDFSWCEEGELVMQGMECDGEEIDGSCGCRRALAGVKTHKATTTFEVVERNLTEEEYIDILHASLIDGGWDMDREVAEGMGKELLRIASSFLVGTVLEKRGDEIRARN